MTEKQIEIYNKAKQIAVKDLGCRIGDCSTCKGGCKQLSLVFDVVANLVQCGMIFPDKMISFHDVGILLRNIWDEIELTKCADWNDDEGYNKGYNDGLWTAQHIVEEVIDKFKKAEEEQE